MYHLIEHGKLIALWSQLAGISAREGEAISAFTDLMEDRRSGDPLSPDGEAEAWERAEAALRLLQGGDFGNDPARLRAGVV